MDHQASRRERLQQEGNGLTVSSQVDSSALESEVDKMPLARSTARRAVSVLLVLSLLSDDCSSSIQASPLKIGARRSASFDQGGLGIDRLTHLEDPVEIFDPMSTASPQMDPGKQSLEVGDAAQNRGVLNITSRESIIDESCQSTAVLAGVLEAQRWTGLDKRAACFPPPTPEVAFQESDIIFFGTALNSTVDLSIRYRLTEFHVHRSWKGVGDPRVVIGSPLLADGILFEEGHEYVVYAFHSSLPMPRTDQCSRTTGGTKEEIGLLSHRSTFYDHMIPVVLSQR